MILPLDALREDFGGNDAIAQRTRRRGIEEIARDSLADERINRVSAQLGDTTIDVDDDPVFRNDDTFAGRIGELTNTLDALESRLPVDQRRSQARQHDKNGDGGNGQSQHACLGREAMHRDSGIRDDDRSAHSGEMQAADRQREKRRCVSHAAHTLIAMKGE